MGCGQSRARQATGNNRNIQAANGIVGRKANAGSKDTMPQELRLRDHQFYQKKLGKDIQDFEDLEDYYKQRGPYEYEQGLQGSVKEITGKNPINEDEFETYVYVGQVNSQNQPHGIGISVSDTGIIDEGCWKDGKKHGKQRSMNCYGDWSFGTYKDDKNHGEWTSHYAEEDGTVKEVGVWHEGVKKGNFKLTLPNGDTQEVDYPDEN